MKILVINSGSSSIKYQLFEMDKKAALTTGLVERIGLDGSRIKHKIFRNGDAAEVIKEIPIKNHQQGLERVAELLMDSEVGVIESPAEIAAVGHRTVHGGERFNSTTIITDEVVAKMRELIPLAPLHNPANLEGIEVARQIFPQATQVAVFDTAFHQTMPAAAYRYAIPNNYYTEHGIRAYGFHGTSHLFVSKAAAEYLGKPVADTNVITAHLGNGCSITAIRGGRSVDTSMGFSPLPGLMMGTRSGDIDPAIIYYLGTKLGMPLADIDKLLNKQSGLLGVSGNSDLRDIEARQASGDAEAQLALDMYTYRIKKYIGAYVAVLGRVDALVFTAGVGENSPYVRQHSCAGLENMGIKLDAAKNRSDSRALREISTADSPVKVLVVPTNEELEIANQTLAAITQN
ncbi:MAG: Acetate kinase [Anaerolineae bacterium]|nr:Acetate kinase [Anaerolineae bacterium]